MIFCGFKRKSFLHKLSLAWLSPKPNYIVGASCSQVCMVACLNACLKRCTEILFVHPPIALGHFRAMPNKGYTTFGSTQCHNYCILLHIVWSLRHFMFASFFHACHQISSRNLICTAGGAGQIEIWILIVSSTCDPLRILKISWCKGIGFRSFPAFPFGSRWPILRLFVFCSLPSCWNRPSKGDTMRQMRKYGKRQTVGTTSFSMMLVTIC